MNSVGIEAGIDVIQVEGIIAVVVDPEYDQCSNIRIQSMIKYRISAYKYETCAEIACQIGEITS